MTEREGEIELSAKLAGMPVIIHIGVVVLLFVVWCTMFNPQSLAWWLLGSMFPVCAVTSWWWSSRYGQVWIREHTVRVWFPWTKEELVVPADEIVSVSRNWPFWGHMSMRVECKKRGGTRLVVFALPLEMPYASQDTDEIRLLENMVRRGTGDGEVEKHPQ